MCTKIRYWRSIIHICSMAKTQCPLVFSLLALALIGTLPSSAAQCTDPSDRFIGELQLTQEDKKALLKVHNEYRDKTADGKAGDDYGTTQPGAENMLELTWDNEAAKLASTLARTCQFKHAYILDKNGKQFGQNIASKMSTKLSTARTTFNLWMKDMVKSWFDEVKLYTFGSGYSESTGHYTQMVWGNNNKLGCGYSYFKTFHEGREYNAGYLVCNYKPGGNVEGQLKPYKEGQGSCTARNLETSNQYPHLCIRKKK